MGIPEILVCILKEIGDANGPFDTKEEIKAMMERIAPRPTACGVVTMRCIVCCPCGHAIPMQIDQPDAGDIDVDKLARDNPGADVRDLTEGVEREPDAKTMVASNIGHTVQDCEKCGRRFIVALEMHCANISPDVELPWDDSEVPSSPSSGLSFSPSVDDSGTVH